MVPPFIDFFPIQNTDCKCAIQNLVIQLIMHRIRRARLQSSITPTDLISRHKLVNFARVFGSLQKKKNYSRIMWQFLVLFFKWTCVLSTPRFCCSHCVATRVEQRALELVPAIRIFSSFYLIAKSKVNHLIICSFRQRQPRREPNRNRPWWQ